MGSEAQGVTANISTSYPLQEISLETDIGSHHSMSTNYPIGPHINIDHSFFTHANIMYRTNVLSVSHIESDMPH